MSEQQHFQYEGTASVKNPSVSDIEVTEVVFLTPARIKCKINGEQKTVLASVDIVNRKVYLQNDATYMSDPVFNYLDSVTILPEDFFAAPDEVTEEAIKAEEDRERIYEETLGESNE